MTTRSRRILPLALLAATAFASPAFAGTDGDDEFVPTPTPAPFVQPVEAPPAVTPAPAPPVQAAPVPAHVTQPPAITDRPLRAAKKAHHRRAKTTTRQKHSERRTVVYRPTRAVRPAVTPVGGVQAGAGGTAMPEPGLPLPLLALGGTALLLGGARALARR
jgi:hypothetical protein